MHSVDHAVEQLQELTGIADLRLGPDGHVELNFPEGPPVHLLKVNDELLELVTPLPTLGSQLDHTRLQALLYANHLGRNTGSARLGLDPADDSVVLCQRIDVTDIDASAFEKRLIKFIALAGFWVSAEGRHMLEGGPAEDEESPRAAHDREMVFLA